MGLTSIEYMVTDYNRANLPCSYLFIYLFLYYQFLNLIYGKCSPEVRTYYCIDAKLYVELEIMILCDYRHRSGLAYYYHGFNNGVACSPKS